VLSLQPIFSGGIEVTQRTTIKPGVTPVSLSNGTENDGPATASRGSSCRHSAGAAWQFPAVIVSDRDRTASRWKADTLVPALFCRRMHSRPPDRPGQARRFARVSNFGRLHRFKDTWLHWPVVMPQPPGSGGRRVRRHTRELALLARPSTINWMFFSEPCCPSFGLRRGRLQLLVFYSLRPHPYHLFLIATCRVFDGALHS
jgi:hypothetical protein